MHTQHAQPSVVLLHGAGANARIFDDVTARLPGVDVHALSYPGRAPEPGKPMRDIESLVEWTHHRVESLGLHSVLLVGHSLGTAVAVGAAYALSRQARTRVHGVLMLATPTRPASVRVIAELWRGAVARGETRQARAMGFLPGTSDAVLHKTQTLEELTPPESIVADWDVAKSIGDRTPPALPYPVAFVSGALDKMSPEADLRNWAARLPNASVEILEGVGHRMDVTHPDEVAQRIAALLARQR